MMRVLLVCLGFVILTSVPVLVHGHGEQHADESVRQVEAPAFEPAVNKTVLSTINQAYVSDIRPIFLKSCLNCHSAQTQYPWYYPLPIAKQRIDQDISDGREHLEIADGFPFGGHHEPADQPEAIEMVIREDTMPPLRYKLLHWDSWLSEQERAAILKWIKHSRQALDSAEP